MSTELMQAVGFLVTLAVAIGGTYWKWPWAPRTCSFCGGVHPDDAIRLLEEGWEVERTDKSYKRYLHPPGYYARLANITDSIRTFRNGVGKEPVVTFRSPVPPVKLYVNHFDERQIARFNSAYERSMNAALASA